MSRRNPIVRPTKNVKIADDVLALLRKDPLVSRVLVGRPSMAIPYGHANVHVKVDPSQCGLRIRVRGPNAVQSILVTTADCSATLNMLCKKVVVPVRIPEDSYAAMV